MAGVFHRHGDGRTVRFEPHAGSAVGVLEDVFDERGDDDFGNRD